MSHLINAETGAVYPPLPSPVEYRTWLAIVDMIDAGELVYDPETRDITVIQVIELV